MCAQIDYSTYTTFKDYRGSIITFLFIFMLLNINQSSLKHMSKVRTVVVIEYGFFLSLKSNFNVILAQI